MDSKSIHSRRDTYPERSEALKKKFQEFFIVQGLRKPKRGWGMINRKSGEGFLRYCDNMLFRNIDVKGKSFLDVGCGHGKYMIWAAINGAKPVIGLEPLSDGSGTSKKNQDILPSAIEFF